MEGKELAVAFGTLPGLLAFGHDDVVDHEGLVFIADDAIALDVDLGQGFPLMDCLPLRHSLRFAHTASTNDKDTSTTTKSKKKEKQENEMKKLNRKREKLCS